MSATSYDTYEGLNRLALDRAGQAEAFDAIGNQYETAFPHKEGQIASGVWLSGELPAGSRILDAGCGTGLPTARQLRDAGHRVVGIDLSPGMVKLAQENAPGAEFHRLDIADLRGGRLGGPGSFDGITAYFSLLMMPRAEIPCALGMLHDLLRPDGLMALAMVEGDIDDFPIPFLGSMIRVSGYLRDDLRRVVCDAGFDIVGEDSYAYAPASTDVPPEIQLFLHLRRA
ncbi:class I SAM-dependent methyltransferase [Streptomyces noursei]|uniref:class I SAM-dependent methyltransferase n=1 Tax=Streptomyces noursei TaxID=1971 RepID=UPI001966912E|nr:class I SAM-dependent methyltransferase [Streptomyces noursei]QRX94067.1 methyltransferase domain-containing protein [Streptomyces noursei]